MIDNYKLISDNARIFFDFSYVRNATVKGSLNLLFYKQLFNNLKMAWPLPEKKRGAAGGPPTKEGGGGFDAKAFAEQQWFEEQKKYSM